MTELITGITTAITMVKSLKDFDKKFKDAEYKNIIADLTIELAEIKIKVSDLMEENNELRNTIKEIKNKEKTKLIFKSGYYFNFNDEGPYCPGCYDLKKQVIRLTEQPKMMHNFGKYRCPVCKSVFK